MEDTVAKSKYDVEVVDMYGDTVVESELVDTLEEAEQLYNVLTPLGNTTMYLRELQYNSNGTYIKTVYIKNKK